MSWETLAWAKNARTGHATRKAVLMVLAEHADERNSCNPTQDRIAADTELSEATVRRVLRYLERHGFLTVERSGGSGAGRAPNRYVLNGQSVMVTSSETDEGGQPVTVTSSEMDGHLSPTEVTTNRANRTNDADPVDNPPLSSVAQFPTAADIRLGTPYPDAFLDFWKEYPRPIEKMAAYKAWLARIADARRQGIPLARRIMAMDVAARSYAEAVADRDTAHVKHPATFLGPSEPWREYARGNPDLRSVADELPRRFT